MMNKQQVLNCKVNNLSLFLRGREEVKVVSIVDENIEVKRVIDNSIVVTTTENLTRKQIWKRLK